MSTFSKGVLEFDVPLHAVGPGERLAADVAHKRLLPGVNGSVVVEDALVYEAFLADVALVRSLGGVAHEDVLLHLGVRPEPPVAFGHGALKRPLSFMDELVPAEGRRRHHLPAVGALPTVELVAVLDPLVVLQGPFPLEGFLTLGARVALLVVELAVDQLAVPHQVGPVGERLAALRAQVRLLPGVDALVGDEIAVVLEPLAAQRALEGQVARVLPLVHDQNAQPRVGFGAKGAGEGPAEFVDVLAVSEQRLEKGEGLLAAGALEARVGRFVPGHGGGVSQHPPADAAVQLAVRHLVLLQRDFVEERLLALVALEELHVLAQLVSVHPLKAGLIQVLLQGRVELEAAVALRAGVVAVGEVGFHVSLEAGAQTLFADAALGHLGFLRTGRLDAGHVAAPAAAAACRQDLGADFAVTVGLALTVTLVVRVVRPRTARAG